MILFVSGATGGHIYPAIAMADELKVPSFFIVPKEYPARKILSPYSFEYKVMGISLKRMMVSPVVWWQMVRLFLQKKPNVMIAMGGGICIPFAVVAWLMRVPIVSFEQNAIPGRATRGVQFFAKKIITAFESAKEGLIMKSKVRCFGNPIRLNYPEVDEFPTQWALIQGKTLLIIGGSQGAKALNEFIFKHRQEIMAHGYHIIHLTGDALMNSERRIEENGDALYLALPYINNMNEAYKKASLVLCRAGATTLSELSYQQLPSILIPYPYAMDNHQEKNASEFSKMHRHSVVINESELTIERMVVELQKNQPPDGADNANAPKQTMNTICELIKTYLE